MVELALKVFDSLKDTECNELFYYEFIPNDLVKEADSNTTIIETIFKDFLNYENCEVFNINLNKGSVNVLNSKSNEFEFLLFEIVPVIRVNGIVFELNSEVYNLNNVL